MMDIGSKASPWSFCSGAMGSEASWERWDSGSIPTLAQWVKDLVLSQLQLRSQLQLGSDPWPRHSICPGEGEKKKKASAAASWLDDLGLVTSPLNFLICKMGLIPASWGC